MNNKKWAVDAITKLEKLKAKKKQATNIDADKANAGSQKASRPPIKKNVSGVHVPSTDWRVRKADPATADDAEPLEDDDQERLEQQARGGYLEDTDQELPPVNKGGPGSGPSGGAVKVYGDKNGGFTQDKSKAHLFSNKGNADNQAQLLSQSRGGSKHIQDFKSEPHSAGAYHMVTAIYKGDMTVKGGPGSGGPDIETESIDMPQSPHISVGTRKGVLENMDYHEDEIPLDKITHVGQKKFVPAKLDKMLLNYGKVRKMPIDVLKVGDDYHVIDGHHRFLAAKNNEEPTINARVRVKSMTAKSALTLGQKLMGMVKKGGPGSGRPAGGGAGGKQNPAPASKPSTHQGKAPHSNPHKDKGHGGHSEAHGGAHFDPYAQLADTAQKSDRTKIMKADAAKQIVYGVVLTPDELDTQMEYMSAEDIEKTAHQYMEKSRVVGKNHTNTVKAVPVESYIAPFDFTMDGGQYGSQFVKKGAWVLAVRILDPKEWQKVEDGDYTGFSIGGFGLRIPGQL